MIFRCDATAATGLGHLSRSLGLAEALVERDATVRFLGEYNDTARTMLASAGVDHRCFAGWQGSAIATALVGASGLVVDSYLADEETLAGASAACPVLVIDDFARLSRYPCQAILNFTVGADTLSYPDDVPTRLLGPQYLLVRRRLRTLAGAKRATTGTVVRRVLLSFGGGAWRLAARISLEALYALAPDLEVIVVAGTDDDADLRETVARFAGGVRLLRGLGDLADQFAWADACVTGGGLTKYEAAYLGLPVAVLSRTEDEADDTVRFAGEGLAVDLGGLSRLNEDQVHTGLQQLLTDAGLRRRLQRTAAQRFPADPTAHAARAWLTVMSRTHA